jgi:hypothetical protein
VAYQLSPSVENENVPQIASFRDDLVQLGNAGTIESTPFKKMKFRRNVRIAIESVRKINKESCADRSA